MGGLYLHKFFFVLLCSTFASAFNPRFEEVDVSVQVNAAVALICVVALRFVSDSFVTLLYPHKNLPWCTLSNANLTIRIGLVLFGTVCYNARDDMAFFPFVNAVAFILAGLLLYNRLTTGYLFSRTTMTFTIILEANLVMCTGVAFLA